MTTLRGFIALLLTTACVLPASERAEAAPDKHGSYARDSTWACNVESTHYCSRESCRTQRRRDAVFVLDFAVGRYRFCADDGSVSAPKCADWRRMRHWVHGRYTFVGDSVGDQLFQVLDDGRFTQAQGVVGEAIVVRYGNCAQK